MSLSLNLCLRLLGGSVLPPQCFKAPSFLKKKGVKLPHFLSIYLSRSKGLVTTWLERKKPNPNHVLPVLCLYSGSTWGLGSERQLGRLLLRRGNLFLRIYWEMSRWEVSCWLTVTLRLWGLHGPPCTDTPKGPACTPGPVATPNQKMFKAWVYIHGGNASVSACNSLLSSLLPLYDWLWSSSFGSLSSSIKGLCEVLPINPVWAPATVDADTFSLTGEEYVSLVCIKT